MHDAESEAELGLELAAGVEHAFDIVFERHRSHIFQTAYRYLLDVDTADEVVAIVFLELWHLRKKVRVVDDSLLPWLLAVTRRVVLNISRRQRRYAHLLAHLPPAPPGEDACLGVDERLDACELHQALACSMDLLSHRDRIVVELCLIDELTLAEAAESLGLPLGTVKSRLHRARSQLRTELEKTGLERG